jgi:hypothetical protein
MATTSASSALTAATIRSTYGRRIVGPTMHVAELGDGEPVQASGRAAIGTSTRTHGRRPPRIQEAPSRGEEGESGDRVRAAPLEGTQIASAQPRRLHPVEQRKQEQADVAQQGQHQERRKEADGDEPTRLAK